MYDLVVNGVEYRNVIYKDKEYIIQYTGDGKQTKHNNRYRVVNLAGDEENHTHLNSKNVCKQCIDLVSHGKIPRVAKKYIIKSCYRLSTDEEYREKVMDLYERKRDRQRQAYVR
jgi:hypothetical protein